MRRIGNQKVSPPVGDFSQSAVFEWNGTLKTVKVDSSTTHAIVREFVSVKEAKALTGVSDWTWREWAEIGKCASVKIGHRLLIPVSEIKRLLSEGLRPACKNIADRERGER
jgi:hypothetical protein